MTGFLCCFGIVVMFILRDLCVQALDVWYEGFVQEKHKRFGGALVEAAKEQEPKEEFDEKFKED